MRSVRGCLCVRMEAMGRCWQIRRLMWSISPPRIRCMPSGALQQRELASICEKPITMNYAEAVEVVRTARANRVFLMEGFLCRRHPQTAKLVELLRQGAIGKVTLIQLQRRLGQLERCELSTLRWRLFARAAVWSRAQGKPTVRQSKARKRASIGVKSSKNSPPRPTAMQLHLSPHEPRKITRKSSTQLHRSG